MGSTKNKVRSAMIQIDLSHFAFISKSCCRSVSVYLKATCSIIGLLVVSTLLWIIACEILWYGSLWMEHVHKLVSLTKCFFQFFWDTVAFQKDRFYVYKIIGLVLLLGLGFITVVVSTSLVLFGIPLTVVHVDHLFNHKKLQLPNNSPIDNDVLQNPSEKIIVIHNSIDRFFSTRFQTHTQMDYLYFDTDHCWSCHRSCWLWSNAMEWIKI